MSAMPEPLDRPYPELDTLKGAADAACRLLKVLSNPDRLLLLCRLAQGEACVSELEVELGIVQPTLSQQLSVLREEGLVSTRREGKRIHYSISSVPALALLRVLHQQFCPTSTLQALSTETHT